MFLSMGVGYDLWLCVGLLPVCFVIQGRGQASVQIGMPSKTADRHI